MRLLKSTRGIPQFYDMLGAIPADLSISDYKNFTFQAHVMVSFDDRNKLDTSTSLNLDNQINLKEDNLVAFYKQGNLVKVKQIGETVEEVTKGQHTQSETFERLKSILDSNEGQFSYTRNSNGEPGIVDIEYGTQRDSIVVTITSLSHPSQQQIYDVTPDGLKTRQ